MNRYRFQGREWSAATGLTNFRARWYDSVTGRWLSKDPIGLSGGLNLYAFCGDDPVNSLDPFGHDPDDDIIDKFHAILDVIGVFDPTPISDGLNSIIYLAEGDFVNAAISAASIVPYIGDGAKAGKYGAKAVNAVNKSNDIKRLSNGEIKSLKNNGINVHDLKINSKQDLFKNSDGDIIAYPKMGRGQEWKRGINDFR